PLISCSTLVPYTTLFRSLVLASWNKIPATRGRKLVYASLLLMAGILIGSAGCGGSSGPRSDSITAAYSGDGNYSSSTSAAIPITDRKSTRLNSSHGSISY